jgi:hypothetical protein
MNIVELAYSISPTDLCGFGYRDHEVERYRYFKIFIAGQPAVEECVHRSTVLTLEKLLNKKMNNPALLCE